MKKAVLLHLFQWVALQLKAQGLDVRLVYDAPKGTLSFQGCVPCTSKIKVNK